MMLHLPTLMLLIGYAVFWLELYVFRWPGGHTTPLATVLFAALATGVIIKAWPGLAEHFKSFLRQRKSWGWPFRIFLLVGGLVSLVMMACVFYASSLPPHLSQEMDMIIYHITLPRQHLIQHSFGHIPWSTADLYLLPVDFALTPYWLATSLPNKWPQVLFFVCFVGVSARLVRRFVPDGMAAALLAALIVLGFHHVGIQAGTAMLDVAGAYLLLAALDSFLKGDALLAGVELAFYIWSKSFVPVQSILILVLLIPLIWMLRRKGWTLSWVPGVLIERVSDAAVLKKGMMVFLLASCLIGGPFVLKSLQVTGSPLFPFYPGLIKTNETINAASPRWQEIVDKARDVRATRDQYGSGRSPLEFLKHLWLIAVPEQGVNNRYDYPVGLMYLLCLGPFVVWWIQSLRQREYALLPLFVVAFWATWWMGTHQTRFLILPTTVMAIVVAARMKRPSGMFLATVTVALMLTALSVVRAHRPDWGRAPMDVLREKDRRLLAMRSEILPGQTVQLDFLDVAFAEFPVDVRGMDSVFILRSFGEK